MRSALSLVVVLASSVFGCGSSAGDANFTPAGGYTAAGGSLASSSAGTSGSAGSALGGAAGSASSAAAGAGSAGSPANGGGAGGAGGAGGTVSDYTGPGFAPTSVSKADARAAYDAWKAAHLEDCTGGVFRVRWENDRLDASVSEGIGYGMLLTVSYGERDAFDGLLAYAKKMHDDNGLMHWLRYGCDAHRDTKYSGSPDYAASDADLDVAMALLMAKCKWGDAKYGDEATQVINAIRKNMFMDVNGLHVLQPGDSTWFNDLGAGCINYSYLAPAYYRAFAKHVAADADFWNKAASDSYELLAKASNPSTGLVRNWGSVSGGSATSDCFNAYKRADSYGSDAARTPWRIATDYLWSTTPQAKAWTDKVTQWVKGQGITKVVKWYNLDGTPDMQAATWDAHSAITVGPFAVGAMTFDQATVNEFAAELLAIPVTDGTPEANYFPRMLKALSLVALTGQFTQCGGQ
ncbi:MAG TPA: glycosyl hydrolase family 8 [Polyangiaceae bacterium]|nr:glycosyl hydrolase family 8 [Polyangiaceae bacterium]